MKKNFERRKLMRLEGAVFSQESVCSGGERKS